MKTKWKDKPILYKIITIISILISISVIVLAILQMLNVWSKAINIFVPLMGVAMLCQAFMQWNNSRIVAWLSIGTAVFIFVCAIVVFFV